jgi:four helix bundle protein
MRRAAISVISNIAEGAARQSRREYVRFLDIAAGSVGELMAQAEVATELGLGPNAPLETVLETATRVKKMLAGLMRAIRTGQGQVSPPLAVDR